MGGPARPWGWHRLDPWWADRLVGLAELPAGALVLDVGAGDGVVTDALLRVGARVVAVERHPGRLASLRARYDDVARVTVVGADAADLRLPRRPFHVVASPPYAITTPLLRRLLHPGSRLVSAHLLLQHQAVTRWCGPGAPGVRSWSTRFVATPGGRVPRRAFTPPPRVDNRVLVVRRR